MAQDQEKRTIISAPNTDVEALFAIYLYLPGNENKSVDDFYTFMARESIERQQFLDEYCEYSFEEKGNSVIMKYSKKNENSSSTI